MAAFNAEIPDDLMRRVKIACAERDTTIKSAAEQSLEAWLDSDVASDAPRPAAPDPELQPLVEELVNLLKTPESAPVRERLFRDFLRGELQIRADARKKRR